MGTRLLKFATVGGLTTVFGVLLYALFLAVLGVNLFVAYIIVFFASVTFSYLLNTHYNYRAPVSWSLYRRFIGSYAIGFAVGFCLIAGCKMLAVPLPDFWIAMLTIPVRFLVTFLLADRAMAVIADSHR
ncbi:MAG: GtrA family protein [Pseudomonadota bacterium]